MINEDELSNLFPNLEILQDEKAEYPDCDQADHSPVDLSLAASSSGDHTQKQGECYGTGSSSGESETLGTPVPLFASPDSRHIPEVASGIEPESEKSGASSLQLQDSLAGDNLLTRTICNPIHSPGIEDIEDDASTVFGSDNNHPSSDMEDMSDTSIENDRLAPKNCKSTTITAEVMISQAWTHSSKDI